MSGFSKALSPALDELIRFVGRPSRPITERTSGKTTIRSPYRKRYPGVYESPQQIVDASAENISPESSLMRELFGVTRQDIDEIAKARYEAGGDFAQMPVFAPPQGGSKHAWQLQTPANTRRVQDVITLAATDPRYAGNYGWYENQPLLDAYIREWGPEEGARRWDRFHQIGAAFSPGSNVEAEIKRSTAADKMSYAGDGDRFLDLMGASKWKDAGKPEGMLIPNGLGHVYHSSNHQKARPVLAGYGDVEFDPSRAPKTGQYYGARTHRNMEVPVGDAHWGRLLGLADARPKEAKIKVKDKDGNWTGEYTYSSGGSPSAGEFYPMQQWYRDEVTGPIGVPAVPAQALQWNAGAAATGVETPVGAPLLELISRAIGRRAEALGETPQTVRDRWIAGKERLMAAGGVPLAGSIGIGSEEELLQRFQDASQGAVDEAIAGTAGMPMPAMSIPSVNPVAGDLAAAVGGVSSPGGVLDPESLAQYLRDTAYGRTSSAPTMVGAALDMLDPLAMGMAAGNYLRQ